MGDFMDENLLKDYFDEAFSQIELIEDNILLLEKNPQDREAIDALFRAAHTLKGGSATVKMDEITGFTHLLEDVMDEVREDKVKIDSSVIDILLDALDVIKAMVNERSNNGIYVEDYSGVKISLNNLINKSADGGIKGPEKKVEVKSTDNSSESGLTNRKEFILSEYDLLEINEANSDNLPLYRVMISLDETNPMRTVGGIQIFTSLREISLVLKTIPEFDEIYSDIFHKNIMYVVASKTPMNKIVDYATIPDATVEVIVEPLTSDSIDDSKKDSKSEDETESEPVKEVKKIKSEVKTEVKKQTEVKNEEIIKEKTISKESDNNIDDVKNAIKKKEQQKIIKDQKKIVSSVLRVDSARIDMLLNLVSEIVINKATFNQIGMQFSENFENFMYSANDFKDRFKQFYSRIISEMANKIPDDDIKEIKNITQKDFQEIYNVFDSYASSYKALVNKYKSNAQVLDRISGSLQEGVMRVRMVPMKQIFTRFPRLVRDLSRELKKDINLVIHGEDTEIDKAMIDDLIDPLIHIVRNSIDHGFETTEEREKLGKSIPGVLNISAMNEGNLISISVSDDGKGINIDRVRQKAIERGLITKDEMLNDQDAYNLIFEPGFSTAKTVTAVSGRGVGLDVVKKNIEKLSGSIRVSSEPGFGTMFTIKIPLTLAIIQGLMVEVKDELYVIPISSVVESIRIKPEGIKSIDNYEVINVRDDVLSLLRLNKLFKLGESKDLEYFFVVIVGIGNKKIGLLVDSLVGEEDIVIKPLKDKYTNTPGIAGATILGDGTVSLILDVSQLIELGLKIEKEEHSGARRLKL